MHNELTFLYDGQCPFCNKFAQLIELKGSIPNLQIKNARENLPELTSLYKQGYDLDQGAILIRGQDILHGSTAINWVCMQLNEPSDALLETIRIIFSSKNRTKLFFPFLIWARRILLSFKGISCKPVKDNLHFY